MSLGEHTNDVEIMIEKKKTKRKVLEMTVEELDLSVNLTTALKSRN